METNVKPMTVGGFLIKLLQGVLIGLGAVLPGISGGVLCSAFTRRLWRCCPIRSARSSGMR